MEERTLKPLPKEPEKMIAKPVTKESKDVTKPKSTEQAIKVINSQSEMAVE